MSNDEDSARTRGLSCKGAIGRGLASPLGMSHFFLFLLEFGLKGFAVAGELLLQLLDRVGVAFVNRFVDFAFHKQFPLGDLGFVFRFQFGDFLLLLFREFGGWRR